MFKRILVPLDGSPIAERALTMARELAVQFDSEITLCQVVDIGDYAVTAISPAYFELHRIIVRDAEMYLAKVKQSLRSEGIVAHIHLFEYGSAADRIVSLADDAFDLIVMTTHGRTGLERWLMGSVAERVMRHTDVPVLLVRPTMEMPKADMIDDENAEISIDVVAVV